MVWTGSKRVGKKTFADENGNPVRVFCNIYTVSHINKSETIRRKHLYFEFPSEMVAELMHGNETKSVKDIAWKNTMPGKSYFVILESCQKNVEGKHPVGDCLCYTKLMISDELLVLSISFIVCLTALFYSVHKFRNRNK